MSTSAMSFTLQPFTKYSAMIDGSRYVGELKDNRSCVTVSNFHQFLIDILKRQL
jgi:hypothetical protein